MRQPSRIKSNGRSGLLSAVLAAGLCSHAAAAPEYRAIAEQNLFDPHRKPWAEPAPPAAAASPLGAEDIQVQGVVVVGGVKRAIVKFGGRLRQFAPGAAAGRANAVLSEGQALGSYTLESVEPRQLVFAAGATRFAIPITRSAQREMAPPAPVLPVIQSPTVPVAEPPIPVQPAPPLGVFPAPGQFPPPPPSLMAPQLAPNLVPPVAPVPAPGAGLSPGGQPAVQQAGSAAPASTAASPTTGMTLLQAIQAAEAARRAGQLPATPVNPFLPKSP